MSETAEVHKDELPNTHWLHLANGDVIESKGVAGSVDGIPVIATYAMPDEIVNGPAEPAHRF